MKSWQYLLPFFFPCLLAAQDLPTPIVGQLFAQPGINNGSPGRGFNIEYERQPRFKLAGGAMDGNENGKNEVEAKERFEAKLKFPLVRKNEWKVLGDIYHSFERYYFESIDSASLYAFQPLDGKMLRRTRLTGYIFKSISAKRYLALRIEASSNGKYNSIAKFQRRYMVYRASAVLGIKKNDDTELGLGVTFNDNFGRLTAFPFALFNHNFNERWGLETLLPIRYKLRHNVNERNLFSIAAEYWSSAYSLDLLTPGETAPHEYIFKNASAQFFVEWETNKMSSWTWFALRGGYSYNFNSRFVLPGTRNDGRIDAFPSSSVFISAAFFLAPPKAYIQANSSKEKL